MSCINCNKKNILQQAKSIIGGTINYVFKDPEIEIIAKPRLAICSTCIFARVLITIETKSVIQCTECLCLVELKTRELSETCPKEKW